MERLQILETTDNVKIMRLYLEKYELLTEEDKRLIRLALHSLMNPPMIFRTQPDESTTDPAHRAEDGNGN
jgi:hypothetical protein